MVIIQCKSVLNMYNSLGEKKIIVFRNCPLQFTENANKDLVKTLTEMGTKIGECKAENQCLETKNEKLEDKNEKLEEQNEKLEDQNEKFDATKLDSDGERSSGCECYSWRLINY